MLSLDAPLDGARIPGSAIDVHGWVHDPESPVRKVVVRVDGQPVARAGLTFARPDVALTLGDPRLVLSGFERVVTLPPELRTPGPHTVQVTARLLDGRRLRSQPVQIELPATPVLPDDPVVSPATRSGRPIRTVWLARSLDHGGSQLRMAETMERLMRAGGWAATVLSPFEGPLRSRLERAGVVVRRTDAVPFDDPAGYQAAVKLLADELRYADLAVAPTVTSFPIVHAAALAGVPSVQRIGETAPLPTVVAWLSGQLHPEVEAHARRAINGSSAIWTHARSVVDIYRSQGYDGRWAVISTGAPEVSTSLPRDEARRLLDVPPDRRLIVMAGTIWAVKGQGQLARAMELVHHDHPDLLVAMVGNDQHPYAVHLREYVAAHGLADHVRLVPFTDDLSTWWAAADATALTPTAESEALSGSLVEGMAHGLPTLVTRVGDAALLVDEGRSGWLAEADAVGSLVRALRRAGEAELSTWRGYGSYAAERAAREGSREAALDRVTALFTSCARP